MLFCGARVRGAFATSGRILKSRQFRVLVQRLRRLHYLLLANTLVYLVELGLDIRELTLNTQKLRLIISPLIVELRLTRRVDDNLKVIDYLRLSLLTTPILRNIKLPNRIHFEG